MKVIIGLGNPGRQYDKTRHNAGFMAVDMLANDLGIAFSASKKTHTESAKKSNQVLVVKPTTFMNLSGQAVRATLDFFQLTSASNLYPDLYVIHDDLDLALGSFKLQYGTGPKSHNGLHSIYEHLGTKDFWHVRIGVDNRGDLRNVLVPSEYVLQQFAKDEELQIKTAITKALAELSTRL